MHRASNTFFVLQATAAVVGMAIVLWSLGLSSVRFAEAANVTSFSDTLSTSEPSVASDHTITFTTPTGVASGETITIDFSDGPFGNTGSVDYTDIDVATTSGEFDLAADCTGSELASAAFSGTTLTITMCEAGSNIAAGGTTTISIGQNATGGAGNAQLTNPTAGSRDIVLTAGGSDSGTTIVAIVPVVTVTASVDTVFQFTVAGVAAGLTVNGTTTGTTTSATEIGFGILEAGVATTAAQDLTVQTNAKNGFVVTVTADGQLTSTVGDIDSFSNGGDQDTPLAWAPPSATLGLENTYGHWGLTSDDTDYFPTQQTYVAASTSPITIFSHTGPVDGVASPSTGTSTTRVGYTVQISSLQEAADDYSATLTYVATPTF